MTIWAIAYIIQYVKDMLLLKCTSNILASL